MLLSLVNQNKAKTGNVAQRSSPQSSQLFCFTDLEAPWKHLFPLCFLCFTEQLSQTLRLFFLKLVYVVFCFGFTSVLNAEIEHFLWEIILI